MNWADLANGGNLTQDVDDPDHHDLPPPETTTNELGNKIEICYVQEKQPDDSFKFFKTMRESRSISKRRRWSKDALLRQENRMSKFGDCQGQPRIPEKGITSVATDELEFEFLAEKKEREEAAAAPDPTNKKKINYVTCKHCGSREHFSYKCPRKELFANDPTCPPVGGAMRGGPGGDASTMPGSKQYVPPHLRGGKAGPGGAGGGPSPFEDQQPTIRISNIPEQASQDDIRELLRNFRHLKLRLARSRGNQGGNRGFAFCTFNTIGDAYVCMQKLNKHRYGFMVLKVEWSDNYKKKFLPGKVPVSEADKERARRPVRPVRESRGYGGRGRY